MDDEALKAANSRAGEWITHGRTQDEQRFSPLEKISDLNVRQLRLAWTFDTGTDRVLEATPLVVDGVMYTTASWGIVFALDARTGKQLWKWDPKVDPRYERFACCDVVNRGVAFYKGRVYAAAFDGRLTALDAKSGEVVWSVVTVDQTKAYTVTAAPRVVKGRVIIGNGGAEYGIRGYISAYNAENGHLDWRFYTVPGDPAQPQEHPELDKAKATWSGDKWWIYGGGGTAWDSMAYDPALNLIYVGTGNGGPWNRFIRSPGGGDNLYLSSILALNPDTGRMAWYYQTTPGDSWDYNATQHIILADVRIRGAMRQVLMQAPKNGFFYMLDRKTGELISAEKYVEVTWATGIDMQTGRPKEKRRRRLHPRAVPGAAGAARRAQLAADVVQPEDRPRLHSHAGQRAGVSRSRRTSSSVPIRSTSPRAMAASITPAIRRSRSIPAGCWRGIRLRSRCDGRSSTRRIGTAARWPRPAISCSRARRRATSSRIAPPTARSCGRRGCGTGTLAAPITYEIDGQQYVSVMAGWGGAFVPRYRSKGLLYTFALNGSEPAPVRPAQTTSIAPIEFQATAAQIAGGGTLLRGAMRALPQCRHDGTGSAPPGACHLRRAAEHPAEGCAGGSRHAAIPRHRCRGRRAARVPARRTAKAEVTSCVGSPTISAP